MRNRERSYSSVSIPRSLIKEIDSLIGVHGYTSRAEVVKEAIRRYLSEVRGAACRPTSRGAGR